MKKVIFKLSPTGMYGLGYNIEETAELEEKQADELVQSGYADYTDEASKTNDPEKEKNVADSKKGKEETATDKGAATSEKS